MLEQDRRGDEQPTRFENRQSQKRKKQRPQQVTVGERMRERRDDPLRLPDGVDENVTG